MESGTCSLMHSLLAPKVSSLLAFMSGNCSWEGGLLPCPPAHCSVQCQATALHPALPCFGVGPVSGTLKLVEPLTASPLRTGLRDEDRPLWVGHCCCWWRSTGTLTYYSPSWQFGACVPEQATLLLLCLGCLWKGSST